MERYEIMAGTNANERFPSGGLAAAATGTLKNAALSAARWRPSEHFFEITKEFLHAPFAFGQQLDRPGDQARAYLIDAGVIFLAATVLAALVGWVWPDSTLVRAQAVVLGVVVVALLVGNGVALVLSRFGGTPDQTGDLGVAALYGAGLSLLWVAAFKLVGLLGPALVPGYSGSAYEALTVLGGMGGVLFSAILLLEWPRRIAALDEAAYYSAVAAVVLAVGVVLKLTGVA